MTSTIKHRIAATGALLATMGTLGLSGAGTASADTAGTQSVSCTTGYLCVQPAGSPFQIDIPAGQAYTFPAPTNLTEIVNRTTSGYCVDANPDFTIAPGAWLFGQTRTAVVKITPVPAGGACAV